MESAARLIKKDRSSRQIIGDDEIIRGIWPEAVGKAIARHTGRLKVVRNKLVVEVEDAMWQRQLFPLSRQIVSRMQKLTGSATIEDVEFRVGVPKREMQREGPKSAMGAGKTLCDEADQIQDAVLKKVYRLSRKRATA